MGLGGGHVLTGSDFALGHETGHGGARRRQHQKLKRQHDSRLRRPGRPPMRGNAKRSKLQSQFCARKDAQLDLALRHGSANTNSVLLPFGVVSSGVSRRKPVPCVTPPEPIARYWRPPTL